MNQTIELESITSARENSGVAQLIFLQCVADLLGLVAERGLA